MSNQKYLIVERKRLEKLHTLISNLPTDALGEGSDGYLRWPIRDEVIDTINHCMHTPLPASAQFVGEMEEVIQPILDELRELYGQREYGGESLAMINARLLLAKIKAQRDKEKN